MPKPLNTTTQLSQSASSAPEPIATYRLQLQAAFNLDDAASLAPYLAELGVSHVYTSPILQSAPGSKHGYNVVDPSKIDDELGGADAHARFAQALRGAGLAHLLDIVPNHMGTSLPHNRWWWDVLQRGKSSPYASYFDLDWSRAPIDGHDTLMLPVLGDHLREVLARRELEVVKLQLEPSSEAFAIRYFDKVWPLAPHTLEPLLDQAGSAGRGESEVLAQLNADPEALGQILDQQCYRLAHWRIEGERLGYRRFFDVTTLIGVRAEDPNAFADSHRLVLQLLARGDLDGVRVDHIDGLLDPQSYLDALSSAAPGAWLLVEKILEEGERLRETWPIAGTTGYDFLNQVAGLFVAAEAEHEMTAIYSAFTGASTAYEELLREKKLQVLRDVLGADVQRLTNVLGELAFRHRFDFTRRELVDALETIVACFPVYRSYSSAKSQSLHPDDAIHVADALLRAKAIRPDISVELVEFVARLLRLELTGPGQSDFVERFQQLAGPAMAKGVEDTLFYGFNRLLSLNEVGGNAGQFGGSLEAFHLTNAARQEHWPKAMLTTTTHDTKRGEDARIRISALSEMPAAWGQAVQRWCRGNEQYKTEGFPDRNTEYLFYQTLVGSWPLSIERATRYLEKASREAKVHTSWRNPDPVFDVALRNFVEQTLGDQTFVADLEHFLEPLLPAARIASLSQTLIKMTAPGVPDIYQGSELWETRLVDPDNRGSVDFAHRTKLLRELDELSAEQVLERLEEGLPKLWVIQRALRVRRAHPTDFSASGSYQQATISGSFADRVVAFRRGDNVLSVAPRLMASMPGSWGDTRLELPDGSWTDSFTQLQHQGSVAIADLLGRFPVALLTKRHD